MNSCIFCHRSTRPWTFCIVAVRLSVRPFSGLVGKAASTPIRLHPPSGESVICLLLALFIFIRFSFNTLAFWEIIDDPSPLLRVNLLICDVIQFLEEALKFPVSLLTVSVQAILSVPSDLLGSLIYCIQVSYRPTAFLAVFPRALACLLVPGFLGGFPNFLKGLI